MKINVFLAFFLAAFLCNAQQKVSKVNHNTPTLPLHLTKSEYKVPYGIAQSGDIKQVLDRIYTFLAKSTPIQVINKETKMPIPDLSEIDKNSQLERREFSLTSYEWGVTYLGMLRAEETLGDQRYAQYVSDRLGFISKAAAYFRRFSSGEIQDAQMKQVLYPQALDDAGAMCLAMIKAKSFGLQINDSSLIDNYAEYIMKKEFRLSDGIFARNRPHKNTVWLDDMFMAVPAIANMGKLTGNLKYYDEAVKQILLFKQRMWIPEKGLFRHGWVEGMNEHPSFFWGRANGWAILTMSEVLDVLPDNYPGREEIVKLFQDHVRGLAALQSGEGFWHQLLDKNDSYLETSATAIYTYCIAHGINRGWLEASVYGPIAMLGWNAIATKVNQNGEVEGTCVGTGMGFDPAYYYYRPVNKYAEHGYGPVLLAGSEIIRLLHNKHGKMNDSALHFYSEDYKTKDPIFSIE